MINGDDLTSLAYLLDPCFQIVNTAGKPLTEGYIEVYYQGTRDKYYCSCDFDGTLLPFQIPLDSLGSNIVLASPDYAYDIYIYNKYGSLIMSRYNVKPGHGAGGTGGLTTITSSDNTVQIERTGNNYDLSIQDTIDRIDHLEDKINAIKEDTSYSVANGYGNGSTFVLTDKDTKDITYLNDMSGWRLLPGKVYQLNFNSKFTLDDKYNTLVEGKLYLDGEMSFSQDWSFTLDDSFDHIHHINGSTIIVVPDTVQYYDLSLKYTFNSVVNCTVELENISIVDITSIVNEAGGSQYYEGDGIDITNNIISVDMDYINEQINIDEKLSSAINICNDYTDNSINEVNTTISNVSGDIINYVDTASGNIINYIDNSIGDVVDVIASATATLEQEIQDIPPQVQSDWEQDDNTQVDYIKNKPDEIELIAGQNIGLFAGNGTLTISASSTDLSNCATHSEVYSATSSAINSANSYTDTAIANLDLTPAVEIVSPNNTISVSSVVDSVNNTKTFYIDTNNPDTNYWIGEANLTLSDQSSQGQVGYYKEVFDYTTKLNGNLDATKLKKGLYLLTANVMVVADEVNNDLAEIQIHSNSSSAISYTSSVFQHDCSVADYLGEPMDESHQIATIVRVMYDDTPMSLIARMDDPTTISNTLKLWFSDICLYELQGTSVGGGSSPSASGSYDAGWGIVINGNVISVNQNIIPDVSNFATRTWVNNQGYLTSIPSYYATETEVNTAIATAINSIPEQVNADWNSTSGKSEILNKPETIDVDICPIIAGSGISITASGNSAVLSCTVTGTSSESYSAGNGIDITNNIISIDNTVALKSEIPDVSNFITSTQASAIVGSVSAIIENDIPDTSDMATKTWVGQQGYLTEVPSQYVTDTELSNELSNYAQASAIPDVSDMATQTWVNNQGFITAIPSEYATDSEVNAALATATNDMATQTWVNGQGYLTSIPSYYATETEVVNAIATAVSAIPSQVQSDWTEDDTNDPAYIQNKPDTVEIDVCPIIAGSNITITASGDSAVISSTGGGATYTEGSGIDITNNVISIDDSVVATQTWVVNQEYVNSSTASAIAEAEVSSVETLPIDICPIIAGQNVTITASGSSAIIDASVDTSTFATKAEVQIVSAAIPDTTGMVTYSGNTAINHVQLVSALPASPDANTLYLIPEA